MDRKEAIEIVKKNWPNGRTQLQEALQTLVPELQESEDERTRKELIDLFRAGANNKSHPYKSDDCKRWLSWLEKQGSQNLANPAKSCKDEPKFKVGDVIRLKESAATYTIKRVTDTTYYTDGWSWSIERCEEDYELVEAKTCKFEQNPAWSKEDDIHLGKAIWYVENPAPMVVKDSMLVDWLKSIKDRYTWKPSEKQIEALRNATAADDEQGEALNSLYNDLKKLRKSNY